MGRDSNGNLGMAIFNEEVGRNKINDQTNPSAFLYPGNLGNGNYCDNSDGCNGGLYIKDVGLPGETIQFKYMNVFLNADLRSITDDTDNDGICDSIDDCTVLDLEAECYIDNEGNNYGNSLPTEFSSDASIENCPDDYYNCSMEEDRITSVTTNFGIPMDTELTVLIRDNCSTIMSSSEQRYPLDKISQRNYVTLIPISKTTSILEVK